MVSKEPCEEASSAGLEGNNMSGSRSVRLTPKQEDFCLAYLETGNASEAYRRAYSHKNMKPESIHRKAFGLLEMVKIRTRLEEIRQPAVEAAQVTLEDHLRQLELLRDKALEAEQYGPAITAETARGKAAGLYVEAVARHDESIVVRDLADRQLYRTVGLAWRRSSERHGEYGDLATLIRGLVSKSFPHFSVVTR